MNASEANWLNMLLCWLLEVPMPNGQIPTAAQAAAAAEALAHHSHQRHGKGISGAEVEQLWAAARVKRDMGVAR